MATHLRRILLMTLTAIFVWPTLAPAGRPAVLVNPHVQGNGTATTIQEGIDMVDPDGKVMVLPGTYEETLVIDKGLTLEAVGGESGEVIVAPAGAPNAAILVSTEAAVTIRGLAVNFGGAHGILGAGAVDLTIEQAVVRAVNPPLGVSWLIQVMNDTSASGGRAQLAVHESFLDGTPLTRTRYRTYPGNRFCFQRNARSIRGQEYAKLDGIELAHLDPFRGENVDRK